MTVAASMSGLTSAARAIDVIGNNIANSQTVGFKTSKVRFADVLAASSASGVSSGPPSAGVSAAIIDQQFTQGSLMPSDNPLDMAIAGAGFFRLNNDGQITYSRDGQFRLDCDTANPGKCILVNPTGRAVTGYLADYSADPQGTIMRASAPGNISIDAVMPAAATTKVSLAATLDARVAPPAAAPFAPNDVLTYHGTTAMTVFDATGTPHDLRMYFVKPAAGNAWELHTTLDNGAPTGPVILNFGSDGLMSTAMPLAAQTYALSGGGSLAVALDLRGTVQYGSTFSIDAITQDGYPEGYINNSEGFSVGSDGVMRAAYSNGQSRRVAQLVLASFVNPNGLISLGDGQWKENSDPIDGSGAVMLDTPGRGPGMGLGSIQSGAKEQSNTDLNTELVALIEQQRNYQASAQTFKILDQILQDLQNATRR